MTTYYLALTEDLYLEEKSRSEVEEDRWPAELYSVVACSGLQRTAVACSVVDSPVVQCSSL